MTLNGRCQQQQWHNLNKFCLKKSRFEMNRLKNKLENCADYLMFFSLFDQFYWRLS